MRRMKQNTNEQEEMDMKNSKAVQNILQRAPRDKLPEIEDFLRDYQRCMTRQKIIENAAQECRKELKEIEVHEVTAKDHKYSFQEQVSEISSKIQELQTELERVQKKHSEQSEVVRKFHSELTICSMMKL
jgi:vacuolar-type H+-ATPase subunit I/STV1